MCAGMMLTLIAYSIALLVLASSFPLGISAALKWMALLPLALLWAIATLAKHRFFTADDINGSGLTTGTVRAKLLQSILQNTLEQTVLCVIANLAWIANAPHHLLIASPVSIILFIVGRVLFPKGYAAGAGSRALGFALSFYPSVLMCLASAWLFVDSLL